MVVVIVMVVLVGGISYSDGGSCGDVCGGCGAVIKNHLSANVQIFCMMS